MAAHLAGAMAARTILPVIGVPLAASLGGLDALLATVQMPPGFPVGTKKSRSEKRAPRTPPTSRRRSWRSASLRSPKTSSPGAAPRRPPPKPRRTNSKPKTDGGRGGQGPPASSPGGGLPAGIVARRLGTPVFRPAPRAKRSGSRNHVLPTEEERGDGLDRRPPGRHTRRRRAKREGYPATITLNIRHGIY